MSKHAFSHYKLQGEWVELLFMARAAELGLTILRPWGDCSPYDVAIVVTDKQRTINANDKLRGDGRPRPSGRAMLDNGFPVTEREGTRPGLLRIQIKSTRCLHSNGAYKCHIDSNGVPYREGMIDFIAAYVIPAEVWYILPLAATRGQSEVLLAPNRPKSKYAKYKEAWHLLRRSDER